jgi:uncharacterized membrane protein
MGKAKQPKLDIPRLQTEYLLDFLSAGVFLFSIIFLFLNWNYIPETIPTHFGITGKADTWGNKYTILLFPSILLILFTGLTILIRYPHIYNYLFPITEVNVHRQYKLARIFICMLKLELILLFTFLELITIFVATGKAEGLGIEFLPIFMIMIFGTIGTYIWQSYKAR